MQRSMKRKEKKRKKKRRQLQFPVKSYVCKNKMGLYVTHGHSFTAIVAMASSCRYKGTFVGLVQTVAAFKERRKVDVA